MPKKFKIHDLEKIVARRAKARASESYTRALLDRGIAQCAKKLGEEAIETGLAAVGESKKRVISEASDLVYHLLVTLRARRVLLKDVEAALQKRMAQSGHAEKASRRKPGRKSKRKPERKPKRKSRR